MTTAAPKLDLIPENVQRALLNRYAAESLSIFNDSGDFLVLAHRESKTGHGTLLRPVGTFLNTNDRPGHRRRTPIWEFAAFPTRESARWSWATEAEWVTT